MFACKVTHETILCTQNSFEIILWQGKKSEPVLFNATVMIAGLGGSVGCASDWWSGVVGLTPVGSAAFFCGDWLWNIFYSHSLPSTDSSRAIVSFWRKKVQNTG